jgi:molybdopterin converting factor small subunit
MSQENTPEVTTFKVNYFSSQLAVVEKTSIEQRSSGPAYIDGVLTHPDYQIRTTDIPDTYKKRTLIECYDLGGAGDCFFKALNFNLWLENCAGHRYEMYTAKSWYHFLSLPYLTYIEDTHIVAIANRLQITILVYSKRGQFYHIQAFGDSPTFTALFEMDQYHYLSVPNRSRSYIPLSLNAHFGMTDVFESSIRMELQPFRAPTTKILQVVEPKIEQTSATEPKEKMPGLEVDNDEDSSQPDIPSEFPEENDPRYREEVSTDYFIEFCASLAELSKKSMQITNIDSKLYYKLRHNLFKTACLTALNIPVSKERPFCYFPELGLQSRRTPDFLGHYGDYMFLIEFTVSNNRDAVLKNKEYFSKYSYEVAESKHPIKERYLYITLDSDIEEAYVMLDQLSRDMGIPLGPYTRDELKDVHNTIKMVTAYFNDFSPEVLSMNQDVINIDLPIEILDCPNVFRVEEQLKGKKSVRRTRVNNLIMRHTKRLIAQLRRRPSTTTYKIAVNFVTNNCYLLEDESGIEKDTVLNQLEQNIVQDDIVQVIGDFYTENSIFQDIEVSIEDPIVRRRDTLKIVDYQAYDERFFSSIMKQKMKTVADCPLEEVSPKASLLYSNLLDELHKKENIVHYRPSPFIFYPSDQLSSGPFNLEIDTGSEIMNIMVKKAFGKNNTDAKIVERDIDYNKLETLTRDVARMGFNLRKEVGARKFNDYALMREDKFRKELEADQSLSRFVDYRQLKSKFRDTVVEKTRVFYSNRVRINLKVNERWSREIEHFSGTKNKYHVVKDLHEEQTLDDYRLLLDELFEPSAKKLDDNLLLDTEPLGKKLADYCTEMREDLDSHADDYMRTLLGHSTLLTSRLCYSLMYYSNIKLNKDDFVYDNLGLTNVLLVVKGGKKIRSTRNSRFFKLMMPITDIQAKVVNSKTNTIVIHKGQKYLVTPWRMLRLGYLKKGFELYHNVGTYFVSAMMEYNLSRKEVVRFMSIKTLLMFSQKRSLETWSSILRYIYLNSLGTHTDLLSLIPDMVMHDVDSLVYILQRQFLKNLRNIQHAAKENKLFDLIWETSMDNFDLAAERFEESIFMARAPFNPVAEHLKNLKSVIDTHDYFYNHVGTLDPAEIYEKTAITLSDNYFEKLEECDFNFDPKMSYIVGDYAGKYLSSYYSKYDLNEVFNSCMDETYTSIATGKGMRDTESSEFFGKKGHDVVFGKLNNKDVLDFLKDFPQTPSDFGKVITDSEIKFMDKISALKEYDLVFDMKDKEQYKGSREIYVMSENTKLMQNPLEKFFGKLCKAFPNELIHKPSATRPKFIHTKIFEHSYEDKTVMHCTMDCRKWAPRSNLWKYYVFIKGMSKYLPDSFNKYFMYVWTLMFNKSIKVQGKFVELLKTNDGYKEKAEKYFYPDGEHYRMKMPYSFMMGIYNYLSSLMHAASQIYFSETIAPKLSTSCNFLAHSDDSGGIIVGKNYQSCLRTYRAYEMFQRSLNHLMSRKKCCLSERSFEMISIMYNNKRYIPMVHKFLTNVSFEPTGSGWYSDVCNIVGKVVDLFNNGGSYLQCYLMMLTLGELYRKAYHLPRDKGLSKIPLAFGGVFNCHPIHLIMIGSRCQEYLLDLTESDKARSSRISYFLSFCGEYSIGIGARLQYRLPYYKVHPDAVNLDDNLRPRLEAVSAMPLRSTLMDKAKHMNRLFDPKYVYSLTGVDTNQLLLATLYYPVSVRYINNQYLKLKDLCGLYQTIHLIDAFDEETIAYPKGGHMNYFKQVEDIGYKYSKVSVESSKSCKPIRYNTIEDFGLRLSQENLMYLSAIEKWPEIKKLLSHPDRFDAMKSYCLRTLPGTLEDKLKFLKNFDPAEKEDRVRSGYLFIPSQVKVDNPSRFFAYSMLYTARRYLISSQKPQLFTPTDLTNMDIESEEIKHLCLSYKLLTKHFKDETKVNSIVDCMVKCPKCSTSDTGRLEVNMFVEMLGQPEFREFYPGLPYVDYVTAQLRGKNIWYTKCDFDIVTSFGTVESRFIEGKNHTNWLVEDTNNLLQLWSYYTKFCKTRGIGFESQVYQDTGTVYPRLAFNDFQTPHCPPLFTKAMVLPESRIIIGQVPKNKVHRRGSHFYVEDRAVDFEIYSVYDVNETFYSNHGLAKVKNILYDVDLEVDKDLVMKHFSSTKIYSILLQDDRHFSTQRDKYERNGFLGQPGSFTRAMALADEKGMTSYRSSYRPKFVTKGAMEFDTVEGVPLLDMFEKCSFSRLTVAERVAFGKAVDNESLSYREKECLRTLKNKMGLESLGTALTLYKHIMRGMVASSAISLPANLVFSMLTIMLDAIHGCMADYPKNKYNCQYLGKPKSWWSTMKTIVVNETDLGLVPNLISQGLLRARSDNPDKFWSMIKEDPFLSCMPVNSRYYANITMLIRGMLSIKEVKKGFGRLFFDGHVPKFRHLALAKDYYREIEENFDCINNIILDEVPGNGTMMDEDSLDSITGGDDWEDMIEEFNPEEREWEGKKYRAVVVNYNDLKTVMQETALNDYGEITIMCPVKYICFPWLGSGDYEYKNISGMEYYVSSFPGDGKYHEDPDRKAQKVEDKTYNELLKDVEDTIDKEEKKQVYLPKSIKDKDSARSALLSMGIYNPAILDSIFPGDKTDWVRDMVMEFLKMGGLESQVNINMLKRKARFHLPGFQGVVNDRVLKAEMVSMFGSNAHYIFTGSVKLNEKTFRYLMRSIKRNFNSVGQEDRAKLLFLVSTMIDTVPSDVSDSWYTDVVTNILDDIESKLDEDSEIVMLPVAARPLDQTHYREKDLFE